MISGGHHTIQSPQIGLALLGGRVADARPSLDDLDEALGVTAVRAAIIHLVRGSPAASTSTEGDTPAWTSS